MSGHTAESDAPEIYEIRVECVVRVIVNREYGVPDDLFTRAETEDFQKHLYGDAVSDKQTVLKHWAYNAVANGVGSPHRLDGWGDLATDAVDLCVQDVEVSDA